MNRNGTRWPNEFARNNLFPIGTCRCWRSKRPISAGRSFETGYCPKSPALIMEGTTVMQIDPGPVAWKGTWQLSARFIRPREYVRTPISSRGGHHVYKCAMGTGHAIRLAGLELSFSHRELRLPKGPVCTALEFQPELLYGFDMSAIRGEPIPRKPMDCPTLGHVLRYRRAFRFPKVSTPRTEVISHGRSGVADGCVNTGDSPGRKWPRSGRVVGFATFNH